MKKIQSLLFDHNPYDGFPLNEYPARHEGWGGNDSIFKKLIRASKPTLIIEVGTWLGQSAIHMAKLCKQFQLDTEIVCVDTWLGSLEFWRDKQDPTRYLALNLRHGFPTVYYQFLANVIHAGCQEIITPFPQTSLIASYWFSVQADLIYIDASHDFENVSSDLRHYYKLLAPKGIMFGHDYSQKEVARAVNQFFNPKRMTFDTIGEFWCIRSSPKAAPLNNLFL